MKIKQVKFAQASIPLLPPVAPYMGSGGISTHSHSLIVEVESQDGVTGWGETHAGFLHGENAEQASHRVTALLEGKDPLDIEDIFARNYLGPLAFIAGIEMALWDLIGKGLGLPVCKLLGGVYREKVQLAPCMGIRPPKEAAQIAAWYVEREFSTLKTKAGRNPNHDLEMVKAMRQAVGDKLEIRIDPNQAYSPEVALQLARRLEPYRLQYFEQPCRQDLLEEHAYIRRNSNTPIALNESVSGPPSVLRIIEKHAADVVMPDFPQAGGVLEVKKVAVVAEAAGLPLVMHCGHDMGLKTAAMIHVAASTPAFSLANDSTYYALQEDITVQPLEIISGAIQVPQKPGLGVEVDREKLSRYQVG